MLRTELRLTLTGWRECSARTKAAVRMLPKKFTFHPADSFNVTKGRASMDRGDMTYPVPDEAKTEAQNKIAAGIAAIADNPNARPEDARLLMAGVGAGLLAAIKDAIRSGQVTGPARSARWIEQKGQNINMLGLTGEFIESLIFDDGSSTQMGAGRLGRNTSRGKTGRRGGFGRGGRRQAGNAGPSTWGSNSGGNAA